LTCAFKGDAKNLPLRRVGRGRSPPSSFQRLTGMIFQFDCILPIIALTNRLLYSAMYNMERYCTSLQRLVQYGFSIQYGRVQYPQNRKKISNQLVSISVPCKQRHRMTIHYKSQSQIDGCLKYLPTLLRGRFFASPLNAQNCTLQLHTCDRVAMLQLEICKFLAGDLVS
jgi:hypothetical protein